MTGRVVRACAIAVALLCLVAMPAEAARFKGKTSQGRSVSLRTAGGYATGIRIAWRGSCGGYIRWKAKTQYMPLGSASEPGRFEIGRAVNRYRDEVRTYTIRTAINGIRSSGRAWRGYFRGTAVVREKGRIVMRCASGLTRWRASR